MRKRAGRSGSNSRHIALLLATTALVGIGAPSIGWADGGSGGDARYTSGGTGGAGYTGASGTDGQGGYANGGGGGGAAGGGPGGAGGSYFTGVTGCCAGGVNPGDPGMNGSDEPASTTYNGGGGGGGAGGSNGQSAPSLSLGVGGTLSGGNGGNGGDGGNGQPFAISGGGGGGGGGGYGAVVTGAGGSNSNAGSISGATGGNGGGAYPGVYVEGGRGSGGDGGDGVVFSGSSPTTTFDNAATGMISGGSGGNGGATGGGGGGGGNGGVGVSAPYGLIITNEGTIVGGNGGTGGGGPNPGPGGAGVAGASLTITNTGTITGGLSGDGTTQADAISFTGGTSSLTLGNTIVTGTLNGNISVSGALSIDPGTVAGTNVTLSNTIYDGPNGAGSLTKTGAGSLTLDATNTYSGGTTIEAGTLVASHTNGTSYDSLGGGTVSLNGGTLAFTQSNQTFANAISVMTAGGTISDAGGTYLTNSITGSGPLTFSSSPFGGISLNADNSNFSGTTIVAAGYVVGHDANSLSPNSAFEVASGTYLFLGTSQTVGSLADYGGAGGLIEDSNSGGNLTLTTGGNNQSTTFSGTIADDNVGTIALVKQGTGTFTLSGANTYSGGTTFAGGTIAVANDGNLGAASGGLIFAGGTLETTADGFASTRAVTLNTAGTVQVDTGTATLSGTIADGTGGAGTLTKTGTGTLTLSGANTYTGATNVNGGALSLTGSLAATAMTVAAGATFAGSGTSDGSVTIQSGGILAPGLPGAGNVGTLTVTGLTFSSGANFNVDLGQAGTVGGANNDLMIDHGQLTLGGVINVNQLMGFGAGTYRLIDYTGALTNNGVTVTGAPAGSQVQASNGQVNLFVAGMNGVLQFWNGSTTVPNGAVNGGSGSWTNDTANTNWTDATGTLSESWASGTGIFAGAAGTVTVNDAIAFNALEFQTSGYTVAPGVGSLTATGAATITTDSGVTTTIAAPIAGTNGLVKQGSGTLILSGTNTYTGDTTIAAGSLQIGNGGTSGSIIGNVADNGILAFDRSDTTTFGGMISGTGALNQIGSGTLTLTGANTYSSGTTINTGALQLGSGGTTGSIIGNVADNGSLAFDRSDTTTFGGTISGTGAVSQIGTGTLTLSNGANTYSGGTTLTAGVLQVAASSTGPAGAITSGPLGTGTLTFNGGTLQAGGALLTINNNAVINPTGGTIDAASQPFFVYGGNITDGSGAASAPLIFTSSGGLGSITLNGANSYAAPTLIDNTGLVLAGSTSALSPNSDFTVNGSLGLNGNDNTIHSLSGAGTVANGSGAAATLTVTPTTTTTFSGVLQDGGDGALGFTMAGPGTQILAGANTYTGATTINAGTLQVNGSIATSSLTTVNNTGTLNGAGTVGATQVNTGGTFAPGSGAPGTSMTVAGNLAFASGAMYMVQLNPTTSSLANVAGTAILAGATVDAAYANGSYVAKRYTILTATGGVSGTFGALVNTNLPAGFKTTLSYDATDAYLNLALSFVPPPGSGLSTNQQNVGNAIVGFFNSNGSIPLVFGGLTPAGLTQASGETATGSQQTTFDAMNLFMGLLTDPFINGRGDGTAYGGTGPNGYASTQPPGAVSEAFAMFTKAPVTSFEQRWSMWGAGFGGSQTTDGNTALGSNSTTSSIAGTAVGADYRFSPDTLAGFALAGGGTSFSVANGGSGRSDLFQAGAFIRHTSGPSYVSAALAYGWQDITTNRTVTIAGTDTLRAEFNANAWSGRLEGGYRFVSPWIGGIGLTPYAAGQFTTFDLPSYAEQAIAGAGTFALNYNAKDVTDTRSELGIRTDKSWAMQNAILTLRGRLAWAHDFDPDRSIAATFQTLPGASFVVNGAAQAHDSALTTASAEIKWNNGWSAAATFEGEFSEVTSSYAGKGVVRYAW